MNSKKKRSIKKNNRYYKKRNNNNTIKKHNKRLIKQKTQRKTIKGGDDSEFKSILLSILNDTYIPFLPTTISVNDKDQRNNYLQCVSAFDLLTIIGKNPKFAESKSITGIVKDVDTDSREIFNVLGDLTKVPLSRKIMSNFMINCARLKDNQFLKQLREYILECEDYLSIKYVNWYKVSLGLIAFDDEFESLILEEIRARRIFLDTDTIKYGLEILLKDESVKNMFKQRLIECGYKPQGFFDKLTGNISWDSYKECFRCSGNRCIVYLDDNYKSFLNKKHKIRSVDKIKILIYVELRLRALSKYIALEGMRIVKKKQSRVTSLLKRIYKDDVSRGKVNKNDLKQFVMNKFTGGSDDNSLTKLDSESANESGADPGAEPGNETVTEPAAEPGAEPASEPGVEPGAEPGVEPGAEPGVEPAADSATTTITEDSATTGDLFSVIDGASADAVTSTDVASTDEVQTEETISGSDEALTEATASTDTASADASADGTSADASPLDDTSADASPLDDTSADASPLDASPLDDTSADASPPDDTSSDSVYSDASADDISAKETTATELDTSDIEVETSAVNVLKQLPIKSSNIIYISYNDTKSKDFNIDNIDDLNKQRGVIAYAIKNGLSKLTGVSDKETFVVYRVRFGPSTTSVEVGINVTGDETLKEEDIKRNLVQGIVDNSIKSELFVPQLEMIKDIYFDGISKYSELESKPSQYKRVLLEMPGKYPETENTRVNFEETTINSIQEILEEPDINLERIHLERVSKVPDNDDRVVIQFLIMMGMNDTKTPNDIIMEFRKKYDTGNNDYSDKYQITNVVFGDPSIILDDSDLEASNTMTEEMDRVEEVDESTLKNLEGNYRRMSYFGCELTLDDLKNNLITADTPLFTQCEPNIQQYFNGFIQMRT